MQKCFIGLFFAKSRLFCGYSLLPLNVTHKIQWSLKAGEIPQSTINLSATSLLLCRLFYCNHQKQKHGVRIFAALEWVIFNNCGCSERAPATN